jgi:hypothetical protein
MTSLVYETKLKLAHQRLPDKPGDGRCGAQKPRDHPAGSPARGIANIIVATGNSQLTFLGAAARLASIPGSRISLHMDE